MNLNYPEKVVKGIILSAGLTWGVGQTNYAIDQSIAVEDRNILPLAIRSTLYFDSNVKGLGVKLAIEYLDSGASVLFARQMILQFPNNVSEKIEILDYDRRRLSDVTHFRVVGHARVESGATVMAEFDFLIVNDIYYIPYRF
jgi:hypothetical protein